MHNSITVRAAGLSIAALIALSGPAAQPAVAQPVEVSLLELPAGFNTIVPRRVSATGDAVVGTVTRNQTTNPGLASQCFLWTRTGGMQVLPVPAGWDGAEGVAVSDDGRKVFGNLIFLTGDSKKAFTWTAETGIVLVQNFPFERTLVAQDMSDDGRVLLMDLIRFPSLLNVNYNETVIREVDGVAQDLASGYALNLRSGGSLSADGSAIAGYSYNLQLQSYVSFLWTPSTGLRSTVFPSYPQQFAANLGTAVAGSTQLVGTDVAASSVLYRVAQPALSFTINQWWGLAAGFGIAGIDATASVLAGTSYARAKTEPQFTFRAGLWTSTLGLLDWATYIQSLDPSIVIGSEVRLVDVSSNGLAFLGNSLYRIEVGTQPVQRVWVTRIAQYLTTNPADIVNAGGEIPRDGIVDGSDFIAFINSFAAQDALADVTGGQYGGGDGIVDGSDFIEFINGFALGE
jgi:hypothetical protein